MVGQHSSGPRFLVFTLVVMAIAPIYLTQPVLPILQSEFGTSIAIASLSVSAVIFGIALANLPFGLLADRFRVRYLILAGGIVVAGAGLFCASTSSLPLFIAARFIQGLFIPSLTTCLAVYLALNTPVDRLNVTMGYYVSATVSGGLSGRLLGGWIHPPLHWRYAFVTLSVLLLVATFAAFRWLPEGRKPGRPEEEVAGFLKLLSRAALVRVFMVPFSAFFVFSSTFNYLPYYLSQPPFAASTATITLIYLVYVTGIIAGPVAGKISNRIGNGGAMLLGAVIFSLALSLTLIKTLPAVIAGLAGICTGFFIIHAAAAGLLNLKLTTGRGRANSLYVLFYYLGGFIGITLSGAAYSHAGWPGIAALGIMVLLVPTLTGLYERPAGITGGRDRNTA
jgi:YNFM family putative membrane transporter